MEILGYILSLFIGISLGLIGSGGSILAVPILVYLFHVTPENATTHSLFIVGITSVIASYKHQRLGNLKLKTALTFAIPSLVVLLITRKYILPAIPEIILQTEFFTITKHTLIMVVFSVLMILSALSMIYRNNSPKPGDLSSSSRLVLVGLVVGLVTGFLGAGGGFLIVPALLFYGKMELKYAIATSLFIVTINSLLGFFGDVINGVVFDKILLAKISAIAIVGMFVGLAIGKRINGYKLKPIFGWFVLTMGVFIILKELLHL